MQQVFQLIDYIMLYNYMQQFDQNITAKKIRIKTWLCCRNLIMSYHDLYKSLTNVIHTVYYVCTCFNLSSKRRKVMLIMRPKYQINLIQLQYITSRDLTLYINWSTIWLFQFHKRNKHTIFREDFLFDWQMRNQNLSANTNS